jgi:hypothetical protein
MIKRFEQKRNIYFEKANINHLDIIFGGGLFA